MASNNPNNVRTPPHVLFLVFLISGCAALIYQVCWQRLLFTAFGVDIESITIIVSVFMCGLGLGALGGGRLADHYPGRIIQLFAFFELVIGIFGISSHYLIALVAHVFILSPLPVIGIANFLLLLIPTCLMGATLPMLTKYLDQQFDNIGATIGSLYFTNTIGASIGAIATGFIIFNYIDLYQTIYLAAGLNIFVAVAAFSGIRK